VLLVRNGIVQLIDSDFSVSGPTITVLEDPELASTMQVWYLPAK
jgi:hypothetical protein